MWIPLLVLKAEELKRIIMSVAAKVARVHAKTLKYGRGRWEGWAVFDTGLTSLDRVKNILGRDNESKSRL